MEPSHKIKIVQSHIDGAGRGVFATEHIASGERIESCPVIALNRPIDRRLLKLTELRNYYFQWGEKRNRVAIALGYGSIYNHSYSPNATFTKDVEGDKLDFYALTNIEPGTEITVNYNGVPDAKNTLWIKTVPPHGG